MAIHKLTADEIRTEVQTLEGWIATESLVSKKFTFATYKDGVVFANSVAYLADKLNHHPDMVIGYAKVTVSISTHDVGGLSELDFELARRIDGLG
ncbi:MAG: 4a-hydroxytetrahydrobiopterin dehydratase [Fimbriimonas sp.]